MSYNTNTVRALSGNPEIADSRSAAQTRELTSLVTDHGTFNTSSTEFAVPDAGASPGCVCHSISTLTAKRCNQVPNLLSPRKQVKLVSMPAQTHSCTISSARCPCRHHTYASKARKSCRSDCGKAVQMQPVSGPGLIDPVRSSVADKSVLSCCHDVTACIPPMCT